MLCLLKLEQVFLAIVGHDAKCFVLEHVPIDVADKNLVEYDLKVRRLVRGVHYWYYLELKRSRVGQGAIVLEQHETGMLSFCGDSLDDLLDLVEVAAQLSTVFLELSKIVQLSELPNNRLVLTFSLLEEIHVLFLH